MKLDLIGPGLFILGLLVGTLQASTGIGWGVLTVPILFLIPGISAKQVVAVSMLASLANVSMASVENIRHGLVHWRYAAFIAAGAAIGAFIGAYFLRNVPGVTIRRIAGLIAVIAGGRMLIGR